MRHIVIDDLTWFSHGILMSSIGEIIDLYHEIGVFLEVAFIHSNHVFFSLREEMDISAIQRR
jgi:hypothetical protein